VTSLVLGRNGETVMPPYDAIEQRYRVGRALAARLGLKIESLRAGLVAAGCALERPGRRGTFVSEGELQKFIDWSRRRANTSTAAL